MEHGTSSAAISKATGMNNGMSALSQQAVLKFQWTPRKQQEFKIVYRKPSIYFTFKNQRLF